jgi:hypothetical protein
MEYLGTRNSTCQRKRKRLRNKKRYKRRDSRREAESFLELEDLVIRELIGHFYFERRRISERERERESSQCGYNNRSESTWVQKG